MNEREKAMEEILGCILTKCKAITLKDDESGYDCGIYVPREMVESIWRVLVVMKNEQNAKESNVN